MGAWGAAFDENDDAADWLAELSDAPEWAMVQEALSAATSDDYLEAPEASVAIAAAEIVAAGIGKPAAALDTSLRSWTASNTGQAVALVPEALQVVARVGSSSELQELWDEGGEADDWRAQLRDLLTRLS